MEGEGCRPFMNQMPINSLMGSSQEYERVVPHIRGALKVVEEKPKTIAEEVLEEIWARKNEV